MVKNFVVQVTMGGKVRFLDREGTSHVLNVETNQVTLSVDLSTAPVAMDEGWADLWASELQGIDGVEVEVKAFRDIDLESLDVQ